MLTSRFLFSLMLPGLSLAAAACSRPAPPANPPAEVAVPVRIAPKPPRKAAVPQTSAADHELLAEVSRRLLAVMGPLPDFVAAPRFTISSEDQVNAFATATLQGEGQDARVLPQVVVYGGMLQRVIKDPDDPGGDADRLAFILSHELGHVSLAHIVRPPAGKTDLVRQVFSRQQETDADGKGMALALQAGYSFRRGRSAIDRMLKLGLNYSSFEGLGVDHPSWNDRLTVLDRDQATLWKTMSAFQNGTFFLLFEQYAAAENCFRHVLREFPDCYEAWTNLGTALLMQYGDALDTDDVRALGIGPLAVGGFYLRPESLESRVRGGNQALWKEAVEALHHALKLKPELALAQANLGVAHLVAPAGPDGGQATRFLKAAADQVAADQDLPPEMRMAVLINAGVAELGAGRPEESARRFDQVAALGKEFGEELSQTPLTLSLLSALLYNRAVLLAASGERARRREAVKQFEQYLHLASPASAWWPLGHERYTKLCQELGVPAQAKKTLAETKEPRLRLLTSVQVSSGATVTLSEPVAEVKARLGEGEEEPLVQGTDLVRLHYPALGIQLLCNDRVLAIVLHGPTAPALPLRDMGPGAKSTALRLGMTQQDLERILHDLPHEVRQIDRAGVNYRFYPMPGLAVRLAKNKVEELVVAQIPRREVKEEK